MTKCIVSKHWKQFQDFVTSSKKEDSSISVYSEPRIQKTIPSKITGKSVLFFNNDDNTGLNCLFAMLLYWSSRKQIV